MKDLSLITKSADETRELGAKIGKHSEAGMVILLDGDLGAGKTCLTQGIAKGLDISRSVTSPTFTIQKIYHGRLLLNHIDAYRLEDSDEDLGFDDIFYEDNVCVIEWGEFIEEFLPLEKLVFNIQLNGEERNIEIIATEKYRKIEERIGENW